jgi:hypothetical protein
MVVMSIWAMYKIVEPVNFGQFSCNCGSMAGLSLLCICPLWILLLHVCRLAGAIYQMASGEVRNGCLQYIDDRLVKTPFEEGCFRPLDWFLVVSLCILTIPAFCVGIVVLYCEVEAVIPCLEYVQEYVLSGQQNMGGEVETQALQSRNEAE